jgi:cytochrome P450
MSVPTASVPRPPADFDPTSQSFLADPAPMLQRIREECPVFFSPELNFWGISRYEDIKAVLRDFTSFNQGAIRFPPVPEALNDQIPDGFFSTAFTVLDPPEHTPYRKVGNSVLTRGRVAALEDQIRELANELVDDFIADEACDLMGQYCYLLTISSIMLLTGMPRDDLPRLRRFAYDFAMIVQEEFIPMPLEERTEKWELHAEVRQWFREESQRRMAEPGDDIISEICQAKDRDGNPMFDVERLATHMTEFLFGGTDTTANTMGTAIRLLDERPAVRAEVRANPALAAGVVEEVLRFDAPSIGIWKKTTRDVEIGGHLIPAESIVYLLTLAANHESDPFPDPGTFDIHRENSDEHLTFGKGRHFCLGAPLARLEARVGLQVLYDRLPDIRVVPDTAYEYQPTAIVRVLERLPVVWGSKAAAL